MAALTWIPSELSVLIRTPGGAFSPPRVRAVTGPRETATRTLTLGGGFTGSATLTKLGSAAWLTIPATTTDAAAFNVTLDSSALRAAGNFTETIRASGVAGFDDADLVVSMAVRPEGPKP